MTIKTGGIYREEKDWTQSKERKEKQLNYDKNHQIHNNQKRLFFIGVWYKLLILSHRINEESNPSRLLIDFENKNYYVFFISVRILNCFCAMAYVSFYLKWRYILVVMNQKLFHPSPTVPEGKVEVCYTWCNYLMREPFPLNFSACNRLHFLNFLFSTFLLITLATTMIITVPNTSI